jgi:tryptophanyl-tRNA synthetase
MSKSASSTQGIVYVLDSPDDIRRKIKRAVTDPGSEVRYDPVHQPGVSNLLEVLAVARATTPAAVADGYHQYGPLKTDAADAVVELLRPVQERYATLAADAAQVDELLAKGAAKADAVASATLARAREAIGLLPR